MQQSPEQPQSTHNPWIFSKKTDLLAFLLPIALSILLLPLLLQINTDPVPLWAFLILAVAFDVAHVWTTTLRTYLDHSELTRRPKLYLLAPPAVLLVTLLLTLYSLTIFWTCAAYLAIYHFIKQDYGFLALYKAKLRESNPLDYKLDKITLYTVTIAPILLWHASPSRHFDWFNAGEQFLIRIPSSLKPTIIIVYSSIITLYTARQIQRFKHDSSFNTGKNLLLLLITTRWAIGSLLDHPLVSLAFINVFHGLPYMILLFTTCQRKWTQQKPIHWTEKLSQYLTLQHNAALYFSVFVLIACLEETLWDGLVWRVYLPQIISIPKLPHKAIAITTALLAFPQLLHYILDAFIWKLDDSNPGLHKLLFNSEAQPDIP